MIFIAKSSPPTKLHTFLMFLANKTWNFRTKHTHTPKKSRAIPTNDNSSFPKATFIAVFLGQTTSFKMKFYRLLGSRVAWKTLVPGFVSSSLRMERKSKHHIPQMVGFSILIFFAMGSEYAKNHQEKEIHALRGLSSWWFQPLWKIWVKLGIFTK